MWKGDHPRNNQGEFQREGIILSNILIEYNRREEILTSFSYMSSWKVFCLRAKEIKSFSWFLVLSNMEGFHSNEHHKSAGEIACFASFDGKILYIYENSHVHLVSYIISRNE